ncbi:hypothetical protein BH23GEM6_BH23GEM6_01940 [soil metagenome]
MMKQEGTISRTPEELDAWISTRPEVQDALQKGGYGQAFNADDLLPLLHVFIGPEHLTSPPDAGSQRSSSPLLWGGALLVFLIVALLLYILLR